MSQLQKAAQPFKCSDTNRQTYPNLIIDPYEYYICYCMSNMWSYESFRMEFGILLRLVSLMNLMLIYLVILIFCDFSPKKKKKKIDSGLYLGI